MKIKLFILILIMIGVSYLLVRNTQLQKDGGNVRVTNLNDNTKNLIDESIKQKLIKTEQIFKQQNNETKNFNPPARRGELYLQDCGIGLDDKNSNIFKKLNKDGLTDIQMLARDFVIEQCKKWYDFYFQLSFEEMKSYQKGIQDAQSLDHYFDDPPEGVDSKTLRKDAKSVLANGGDESSFTAGALRYLFKHDYNFLKRIADELNISSINYAKQNRSHIISLYQCSVSYEAECSANSMVMMSLCIEDEKVCGMSFDQIIASWVPANSYSDLLHVVDIIRSMVRQGYFDDALDELP